MYDFIEKWEAINREVKIKEKSVDIIENDKLTYRFYTEGYYYHLDVFYYVWTKNGISSVILNLLNETMEELEEKRNV